MTRSLDLAVKIRGILLRWRWPIMAALSLAFITFEIIEHQPSHLGQLNSSFLREILIFGVLGPLLGGATLGLLAHTQSERVRVARQLNRQQAFNEQLANTREWDKLTALVVEFPRTIAPVLGASLLVYDEIDDRFQPAAEWWDPDGRIAPGSCATWMSGLCEGCASARLGESKALCSCRCLQNSGLPELSNSYCLPLIHGDLPVAMLYLYLPPVISLTGDQADLLDSVAPSIAVAIESARPQRSALIQAEAARAERQRIARDLHDTLGQSLGYMHLKLDQLTGDDALLQIGAIRQELERIRAVVDGSYEELRTTLDALRHSGAPDLVDALRQYARSAADRSNLEIRVSSQGQPHPLPAREQRQILFICQEALANAEKHAGAARVDISILWEDDHLTIQLADDGRGFELTAVQPHGHHGLEIMRERAQEIDGHLSLTSSPGSGTEMALSFPLVSQLQSSNGDRR